MVTLIILGVVLLLLAFSVMRSNARQRREAEERQRREEEARRLGGDGPAGVSPFSMLPFGGLFDQLLSGSGGWTRSLELDPETGRWVDTSDREPEAVPADEGEGTTAAERRRAPRPQAAAKPSSPLSQLFGSMGGMGGGGTFDVEPPSDLATFADVGGMDTLKQELRDTIGLVLEHPDDAERYGIEWNGVLLHGPPGVGKTFMARATAGEYGLSLMHVSTGDLVSSLQGGSAQNIDKAFSTAMQNLPCLLFFDEFDSVAQRRSGSPDQEARKTVNQLLTSLESIRGERRLLVMAATNGIEHLDPAVIRPGRFDRHIRIDLPDAEARRAIFAVELSERPTVSGIDLDDLVVRTEGMTPAVISKIVDTAALEVFRQATETGDEVKLDSAHLLDAIKRHEESPLGMGQMAACLGNLVCGNAPPNGFARYLSGRLFDTGQFCETNYAKWLTKFAVGYRNRAAHIQSLSCEDCDKARRYLLDRPRRLLLTLLDIAPFEA